MKTIIATLAAVGALTAVAAPAAAQPYGYDGYGRYEQGRYDRDHDGRPDRYEYRGWSNRSLGRIAMERVARATEDGSLSPRESWRLRAEARELYQMEARIAGNGLDYRERQYLEHRFNRLMAQLRYEQNDRDYGYGYYR